MKSFNKDELQIKVFETRTEMGKASAADFAAAVKEVLKTKDSVRVVFAAAPSQEDFYSSAVADKSIDFSKIDAFHMDEYIGLAKDAPQRFGNFLKDKIFKLRDFHSVSYIEPDESNPQASCDSYAKKLNEKPIDIVCMGIGENGHIAFNDPGVADFNDPHDVKIVNLDDVCRMQQVHDKCFDSFDKVPQQAVTLTVPMLMKAKYHFCMVPAATKANAVKKMLEGPIEASCPCTVLRTVPGSVLYLDADSSALI
ncbi:6-phosphogluconolactonase [Treponema sp. OMZ 840]|uniref:6-phosphogluconolactonase n=1 Tax=Treponema sp. OMZ 840 TaxID=244313 RepID=UPI003D8D3844